VPEGTTTRPTTDRVREATFNALYSMAVIEDATFVDLFAGSGALGLEAISRGAAHVTFVERDRHALAALKQNIETRARTTMSCSPTRLTGSKLGQKCSQVPTQP